MKGIIASENALDDDYADFDVADLQALTENSQAGSFEALRQTPVVKEKFEKPADTIQNTELTQHHLAATDASTLEDNDTKEQQLSVATNDLEKIDKVITRKKLRINLSNRDKVKTSNEYQTAGGVTTVNVKAKHHKLPSFQPHTPDANFHSVYQQNVSGATSATFMSDFPQNIDDADLVTGDSNLNSEGLISQESRDAITSRILSTDVSTIDDAAVEEQTSTAAALGLEKQANKPRKKLSLNLSNKDTSKSSNEFQTVDGLTKVNVKTRYGKISGSQPHLHAQIDDEKFEVINKQNLAGTTNSVTRKDYSLQVDLPLCQDCCHPLKSSVNSIIGGGKERS